MPTEPIADLTFICAPTYCTCGLCVCLVCTRFRLNSVYIYQKIAATELASGISQKFSIILFKSSLSLAWDYFCYSDSIRVSVALDSCSLHLFSCFVQLLCPGLCLLAWLASSTSLLSHWVPVAHTHTGLTSARPVAEHPTRPTFGLMWENSIGLILLLSHAMPLSQCG